jgi:hypothetical protein
MKSQSWHLSHRDLVAAINVAEFLQLVGFVMLFTAIVLHEPHGMME